ncbi:DUF3943 domain-containing protein [Sorangium sp. So ce281]|uniref:DUF3943 domain-containing protein n=1 Tax=unclassified Sorangium TaxID=2621164 RepID=UPI003F5DAA99
MAQIHACAAAILVMLASACAGQAAAVPPAEPSIPLARSALPPEGAPPAGMPLVRQRAAAVAEEPAWAPPIVHTLAVLTVTRSVEAVLWPEPFADFRLEQWGHHYGEALTKPPIFDAAQPAFRWDHDPWPINVVGHGLLGSEMYLRARICRFGAPAALAFAIAGTHLWEYGYEANGVRPSALDLVYTPLAGVLLGELRFATWRAAGSIESAPARLILRALMDPFGEIERGAGVFGC